MTEQDEREELSPKHEQFITEYFKCWNQTEAYQRVYPECSRATARANAARLLANASVKTELKRRVDEMAMSADEVLVRLAEQARAPYAQFVLDTGRVDLKKLKAAGLAHLIKGIKKTKYGIEVEFHDAQAALALLGKHHKLFVDRTEVTGKDGEPLRIEYVNDWRKPST